MAFRTINQSLFISMVHRRIDRSRGNLNIYVWKKRGVGTRLKQWLYGALGHAMSWVEGKISYFQSKLKWWSRVAIGNITRLLKEKKEMLRKVEDAEMAGRSMNWIKRLKKEINNLLSKEEKKSENSG